MSEDTTKDVLIVVLLSVIAVLFSIIISLIIGASEKRQKFAMKLFLFCPGSVIHSNSNIVSILAGNFDSTSVSMTNRDEEFYQDVVNDLPDAIVTLSSDFTIKTANKAIKRIFGIEPDTVIGTKIMEFGQCFDENPFSDIEAQNSESKTFERVGIIKRENDTDIHINIIFEELSDAYVVSFRDITQSVMYNRLINDEQQKTDTLLASILPAKLVPRVQAGEKNISFSIQSATVLFLDIVSFTPWCGSNEASYVMSTLNRMFKDFDHILSTHPTMTKIKCIGDCYMAAGGLFMDVNQPTIHAKDVVEFGLEVIEALEKINEEIGESLRIRVGVNTGGPLVAGVLGTGKPTFEILGPTINMAQQMEHHGVPMKVHVSRATYELIYGGNFNVKERGEIEIKQGTTVTYVVTRK